MRIAIVKSLSGIAAAAALLVATGLPAGAQPKDVVIGVLYRLTGPTAQAGIDSKAAAEIAWPFEVASADVLYPLPKWSDRR